MCMFNVDDTLPRPVMLSFLAQDPMGAFMACHQCAMKHIYIITTPSIDIVDTYQGRDNTRYKPLPVTLCDFLRLKFSCDS